MGVIDNDVFITKLSELFMANRDNGSVYVTMKAVQTTEDGKVVVGKVDPRPPTETRCLIRATDGSSGRNKVKLSTIVKSKDLVKFQMAYTAISKNYMDNLKKREKKKSKSAKKKAQV